MLGLCDRFHKLPSEIDAEYTDLVRMIHIQQLATPEEQSDGG